MAWDCGAGHCFDFLLCRRLALNIFPFLVTTAKLLGEFYNNRRSAENRCPRFAYSFVSLCCANTIGPAIRTAPVGKAQRIKKKSAKTFNWHCEFVAFRLLALRRRPALPLSAACNVAPITFLYSASPIHPELAYNLGSTVVVQITDFVHTKCYWYNELNLV
jgi:hypothetical protein